MLPGTEGIPTAGVGRSNLGLAGGQRRARGAAGNRRRVARREGC